MSYAIKLDNIISLALYDFEDVKLTASETKAHQISTCFTTSVLGMRAISQLIEERATSSTDKPFKLYSSFQYLSRFKPQQERYRKIANNGSPVYVFGIPDAPIETYSNLIQVPIERTTDLNSSAMARFWFVVLDIPNSVSIALLSRELPSPLRRVNGPSGLIYRNFEGFRTYDKSLIAQITDCLDSYIRVNAKINPTPSILSGNYRPTSWS